MKAVKIAGGIIGFAAACAALYPLVVTKIFPDDGIKIIRDSQRQPVILTADKLNSPVVQSRVRIDSELISKGAVHIVTNELAFGSNGKLVAPHVRIFATRVLGGTLDVSGSNAQEFGGHGDSAGTIFVLAARVKDTDMIASGGNGKIGSKGKDGSPGRDGRCTSKILQGQRWVGATDGGNGSNGQDGGNGGSGGDVKLLLAMNEHPYQPKPNVNGGQPGEGGHKGKGGKGGKGCAGPGGIQASHPGGLDGSPGNPGIRGEPGTFISRDIKFRNVKKNLDNVNLSSSNELKIAMEKIFGEE